MVSVFDIILMWLNTQRVHIDTNSNGTQTRSDSEPREASWWAFAELPALTRPGGPTQRIWRVDPRPSAGRLCDKVLLWAREREPAVPIRFSCPFFIDDGSFGALPNPWAQVQQPPKLSWAISGPSHLGFTEMGCAARHWDITGMDWDRMWQSANCSAISAWELRLGGSETILGVGESESCPRAKAWAKYNFYLRLLDWVTDHKTEGHCETTGEGQCCSSASRSGKCMATASAASPNCECSFNKSVNGKCSSSDPQAWLDLPLFIDPNKYGRLCPLTDDHLRGYVNRGY